MIKLSTQSIALCTGLLGLGLRFRVRYIRNPVYPNTGLCRLQNILWAVSAGDWNSRGPEYVRKFRYSNRVRYKSNWLYFSHQIFLQILCVNAELRSATITKNGWHRNKYSGHSIDDCILSGDSGNRTVGQLVQNQTEVAASRPECSGTWAGHCRWQGHWHVRRHFYHDRSVSDWNFKICRVVNNNWISCLLFYIHSTVSQADSLSSQLWTTLGAHRNLCAFPAISVFVFGPHRQQRSIEKRKPTRGLY